MTIGEKIRERAQGVAITGPDWFANELYTELSEVAEVRLPEIGELCFFLWFDFNNHSSFVSFLINILYKEVWKVTMNTIINRRAIRNPKFF